MRSHAHAAAPAALLTIALLGACGGDGSTNPLTGFDPDATVHTVAILTSIVPDSDAIASLELAAPTLTGAPAAAVAPQPQDHLGLFGGAALPLLRRTAGLAASATAIPAELLGQTLVYSPNTTGYTVDDAATGAPIDGVRVVYYSIEPFGQPALPLDSLGYMDITEQSTDATAAVRIQVVRTSGGTPLTISDFVAGHSATATETVDHITLEGYVANGNQQTDVAVIEDFAEAGSDQIATFHITLSDAASSESVDFIEKDSVTVAGSSESDLTLTVDGDEGLMVLDVIGTPSGTVFRLDGTVEFDGTVVANIGGTTPTPSFSNPDGSALPSSDRSSLLNLWVAVGVVFQYGFDLVSQLFLIALSHGWDSRWALVAMIRRGRSPHCCMPRAAAMKPRSIGSSRSSTMSCVGWPGASCAGSGPATP